MVSHFLIEIWMQRRTFHGVNSMVWTESLNWSQGIWISFPSM